MLQLSSFLIVLLFLVPLFGELIRLEWSLGSPLPVSKMLNSGTEQDLYCSVEDREQKYPVLLQCPMHQGICMENCNHNEENLHIKCTNMTQNSMIIFRYRITVFKTYEGSWKCQYKSAISRNVELAVTNKPYINSFIAIPNPVWKGSPLNVTCQAMPMPGISDIQFFRLFKNHSRAIITNEYSDVRSRYADSVLVTSARENRDEKFQCDVFTMNGESTTKQLEVNILYFPSSIQLISSEPENSYQVGRVISFQCSADGGNPKPVLSLHRRRQEEEPEKLIDTRIVLSRLDNGATFYCELEKTAGVKSRMKSNEIKIKVRYPPDSIQLSEETKSQLRESQTQNYVCLCNGGSEPQSHIEWSMTDSLGKKVGNSELDRIIEKVETLNSNFRTLRNSIRITILRNLNGYTLICSIIYENQKVFSQNRSIKVEFAPNSISLNSNPLGAILKGTSVALTCLTGTANPPPKIQWYKTKPGQKSEDVTARSTMDLVPSNYSGVAIYSSINVYDVTKNDHGTIYQCTVSHLFITTEIVKEYFLNVLFPPIVQLNPYPQPIEGGDYVYVQCRTSGGNPDNLSLYRYQWQFCPVSNTYQRATNTDVRDTPMTDIRKQCSDYFPSSTSQQSATLNITSINSKQRGWYSCMVYSPGGSAIGYSFIDVLYPPILTKQSPERVYAKIATDVVFKFEIFSNPLDIDAKWFFRPQQKSSSGLIKQLYDNSIQSNTLLKRPLEIKPFGRLESIIFDNFTVHLLIRSILYSDYGEYYCEVSNRLGKKGIQFHIYPSNDITIAESSINIQFSGRKVVVHFDPPTVGHFSHLVLRICSLDGTNNCRDMQISSPLSGKASTILHRSPTTFSYRILVFNGSSLLQITNSIQKSSALQAGSWVEMSFEMMVAVIIGVVGILLLLFVALITLILLRCKQNKSKDLFVENNSVLTANSQQRQDYFLLNSSANTSLLKNGCHCFPNYPIELRSDNGSDHSAPSQGIYHPMMMRRKIRDNGEMNSVHSGGSFPNPDVVLTDKTSIGSGNNQNLNITPQFNSLGNNNPTKVTFINGRLHSIDGQRQDLSLPEDFTIPQNIVYAAVDDGTNQTRLIPIATKNLHSEYPLFFQMNNQTVPTKPYDSTPSPLYSTSLPHCEKSPENDNYRDNSSSTNTDSNPYSSPQHPSVMEVPNDIRITDNQ